MDPSLKETIRLTVSEELKDYQLERTPERMKFLYANMLFKTQDPDITQALIELIEES